MTKRPKPAESEVEAYGFIRGNLRELGWTVKDPSRGADGQVWTQNQCLRDPDIKRALGTSRPENIVKIGADALWVIEAKSRRMQIDQAVTEATRDYADKINAIGAGTRVLLATGVAGNETAGYLVETRIRREERWLDVTINRRKATGLLSPKDVRTLMDSGGSDIADYSPPQHLFLQAAERINETLHIGGINKNDRAKTMAALLLSVIEEPPNLGTSLTVLIGEINARSESVLREHGKPDFAPHVRILPPTNKDNHVKYKNALILTIQELLKLNVRSAMNSSTDVLGQFYEVFLKYGNGAKEIGIVLTPRHITRFAVEAVGVGVNDIVLDPACGTGGFLVAALDHVRRQCSMVQFNRFKERSLFGIEQEPYVALLAIVNMIFRGDGKHNIAERNCFSTYLRPKAVRGHATAAFSSKPPKHDEGAATRVLMNPPFALRASDEKEHHFVTHALKLMADHGLLFALVPLGCMFREGEERLWREQDLLTSHTLLAVVSLPEDLFVPAATKQVIAVIIRKGVPHPKKQAVLWGRIAHDGHIVVKRKRLLASEFSPPRREPDQLAQLLPELKAFLAHPTAARANVPEFLKAAPINFADPLLELIPEAYLESRPLNTADLKRAVDQFARETVSFLVRFDRGQAADADADADAAN
jgi:type I restriction-modification system DNA methylase subunit